MKRLEALLEWGGTKKEIALLALSGAALLLSIAGVRPAGIDPAWAAIVLCGIPILLEAFIGLVNTRSRVNGVRHQSGRAGVPRAGRLCGDRRALRRGRGAFIMQLGALLEDLTVARARAGIEKLVHLTPRTARRLRGGAEEIIPAEQVCVGDMLRVLPGEASRWTASSPREILRWIRP